jgi:hypothetical protein
MQDIMANGNYGPYLAQALTPPMLGSAGMSGYGGMQGIAPQFGTSGFGNPGFGNPAFSQFGQSSFGQGNSAGFYPPGLMGQQGFGQQPGQPQQVAAQQQQIAATLHQLAHHMAMHSAVGQQVGATLQQLAQYCTQGVIAGQQFAQLLNQLAHQCAWQAQAARTGIGIAPVHGQPFGHGGTNVTPFGQPNVWGSNRPFW